jgi:hypothetical protein
VGQEGLNLGDSHLAWMPQLVKADEAPNPKRRALARYEDCNGNTGSAREPDRANELTAAAGAEFP